MHASTSQGGDSIAVQILDEPLMVMLERLVRVHGRENVAGIFDPMSPVACENSDPKAAAELFTQNVTYYEISFDEPMAGLPPNLATASVRPSCRVAH